MFRARDSRAGWLRFALAAALGASAAPAHAVTIDGRFDPNEGYSVQATIEPQSTPAPVDDALAYFFQDAVTKDLSILILLPTNYTDNSYGVDSGILTHTHRSWYSGSGGAKNNSDESHTFKDLVKSDHAAFSISRGGNTSGFGIDYLFETSMGSGDFDSGPATEGGGDPDGVLLASATSLDFNVNTFMPIGSDGPFSGEGTGVSPELADPSDLGSFATLNSYPGDGWIMANIYEFMIDGDSAVIDGQAVLGDSGFINGFSLTFTDLHASPSKKNTAGAFVDTEPGDFQAVPEPTPLALFGLGTLLLAAQGQRLRPPRASRRR